LSAPTSNLELATSSDNYWGPGLATLTAVLFNVLDDIVAGLDFAEDDVLSVQPVGDRGGHKELGAVGVGAAVGHGEEAFLDVFLDKVLVVEFLTVDGLAAGAVLSGEVTALAHEAGDDSVEWRTGVTETFLPSAEGSEVLDGLWHNIVVHVEDDSAG